MDDLQRLTFRVRHDCPLAEASREAPGTAFEVWSGHRFELVAARGGVRKEVVEAAWRRHLHPERVIHYSDGLLALWRPKASPKTSISRRLEKHGLLWMQPLRVLDGWERFEVFAFDDAGARAALADLRAEHPVRVVRRQRVGADDVAGSLFLSLLPALASPTDRQAEALVAAFEDGYYQSPRGSTTAKVAAKMDLGRSAFEERLRGAENRLMADVVPALKQVRHLDGPTGKAPS